MESLSDVSLEAELGQGTFGRLWRARDAVGTPIAVRVVDPELTDFRPVDRRFARELADLVTVRHPHLVQVVDFVARDDQLAIIHEFVDGPDLPTVLAGHPSGLPLGDALRIAAGICTGLSALQDRHIRHEHLQPSNVLLANGTDAKLTDFGVAWLYDAPAQLARERAEEFRISWERAEQVRAAQAAESGHDFEPSNLPEFSDAGESGSPSSPYLAPERLRGRTPTPSADVYAAGVILHELLSGALPAIFLTELDQSLPPAVLGVLTAMLDDNAARRPLARDAAATLDRLASEATRAAVATGGAAGAENPRTPVVLTKSATTPPAVLTVAAGDGDDSPSVSELPTQRISAPHFSVRFAAAEPLAADLPPVAPTPAEPPAEEPLLPEFGPAVAAAPAAPATVDNGSRRRRLLLVGASALAVVALATGVTFALSGGTGRDPVAEVPSVSTPATTPSDGETATSATGYSSGLPLPGVTTTEPTSVSDDMSVLSVLPTSSGEQVVVPPTTGTQTTGTQTTSIATSTTSRTTAPRTSAPSTTPPRTTVTSTTTSTSSRMTTSKTTPTNSSSPSPSSTTPSTTTPTVPPPPPPPTTTTPTTTTPTTTTPTTTTPTTTTPTTVAPPPEIGAQSLPDATVGLPYTESLSATGAGPLTWSITGGELGGGLELDAATGTISADQVSSDGQFDFTVQVSDANGGTATQSFSITSARLTGDVNRDGVVGCADLAIVIAHLDQPGSADEGDVDGNGTVDLADVDLVQELWTSNDVSCLGP